LGRIAPIQLRDGIKLNVYGRTKTGKTRFACTFAKRLLLVGTEDGTKSVSNVKDIDFVRLKASTELDDITDMLRGGKYKTVVLDTAGGLQDLILKEILGLADVPVQKSWGMAQQKDWQVCGAQFKERMNRLLALADDPELNLNAIVIAHERNFNDENTSDVMMPSVGSALTPTAAAWLNGACDYICQAFIRPQEVLQSVKIGGKETQQKRSTGKAEYCLRIGPHPVYMTGFRLPIGVELPDVIVDPSYSKIEKLIRGK
jgi:hypothetical protein